MIKLSLAIITKDAAEYLKRCLESVKDVVDEIVVVDTGSSDNTIEIAKSFTDKVYEFKWIDDFSAARNYSFSKSTGDFILWLDSDDVIYPEDIEKIKNIDYSDKEIIIADYIYAHDEFGNSISTVPRERIVKRSLNLKWEQPIHEYLRLNGKTWKADFVVHHTKMGSTSERNIRILEKVVKKDKNNARNVYYLAKEYYDSEMYNKAISMFKKFVNMNNGWWENKYKAYYFLALCYLKLKSKDYEKNFKKYIFKSIEIEERRAEPYYLLGDYFVEHNLWEKAIHWYLTAANCKRGTGLLDAYEPSYYTWKPWLSLCVAYNAIGKIKEAYDANEKVLQYRPKDSRAINNKKILENALKRKRDGEGKSLHLGCGNKKLDGYVNVDIFNGPIVDEVFNMSEIPYIDNTIKRIYSEHAIEHVGFEEVKNTLKESFRVLQPGGELQLLLPDFEECCKLYLKPTSEKINYYPAKQWYKYTIFGIQKSQVGEPDEAQYHLSGFSKNEITELLENIGFIIDYCENYNNYGTPSMGLRAVKPVSNFKIGWIAPINWEAAQTRIRVLNVNRWFRSRGYYSNIVNYPQIINENYDIAIVGKSFDINHFKNIKSLKQQGKTVFCDLCEDILGFPCVNEILAACDKVICCSYELEKKVQQINLNTSVIEDGYET